MVIIEMLKSAVFGIVQGITEWLPISSTGHLILANELIKLNVSDAFWEMFLVVIQLASILAVIVLYFRRLNPFSSSKTPGQKSETFSLWGKVIATVRPLGAPRGSMPYSLTPALYGEFLTTLFDAWYAGWSQLPGAVAATRPL